MASTIKDIAKKTGLGLATISSYLNGGNVREKNRVLIEQAIEELHFEVNEVARGLKTNTTKTVGIVIPELNNVFCAEIITEIEDILRSSGYASIICDCRSDITLEKEAIDFLYKKRVDGIINIPVNSQSDHLAPFLRGKKPIVLIDRKINGLDCDCVLVDNLKAAKTATEELIRNGHTSIGMIGGPVDIFTAQERLMGYKLALLEQGIDIRENLIAQGDYTIKSGVECFEKLVSNNPSMTALFVANYEMTMGAMIGANELGMQLPEQLSIIGFDNIEFARACVPKLSIVTQPTVEIARNAAKLILARLQDRNKEYEVIKLNTELRKGKSVMQR